MPAMFVFSSALTFLGAGATFTLPEPHIALPKFSSLAELFPARRFQLQFLTLLSSPG
jgi:hypothetical protein